MGLYVLAFVDLLRNHIVALIRMFCCPVERAAAASHTLAASLIISADWRAFGCYGTERAWKYGVPTVRRPRESNGGKGTIGARVAVN